MWGIKPPGMNADNWEDLDIVAKSDLLAYSQIRESERQKEKIEMVKAFVPPF